MCPVDQLSGTRKGRVTGVFKDNAQDYVYDKDAAPVPPEQEDRALDTAMSYVASKGVTSVHNMSGFYDRP